MAAITAYERNELVAIHLTMFGTGPNLIKLAQLVTAFEGGKSSAQLASELASEPGFASVATRSPNSFAVWLADTLLASDIPTNARAWALDWVLTQLDTKSRPQIIVEAVQAIRATTNANYASSQAELVVVINDALSALAPETGGRTHSLTAAATDVIKADASNDTIIGHLGETITLQASDEVDGGAGEDTFRIVSDGPNPQSVSGFTVRNVETLEVQAKATGGTTLGLENVSGLATIRIASGSAPLALNNLPQITALELRDGLAGQTVTLNYRAAAVQGTNDTQHLVVSGTTAGSLTVHGIETLAITATTADAVLGALSGNALKAIAVAGNKHVGFSAALPASVATIDASAQTAGGISLQVGATDVSVKGGAGNDTVTFSGMLTTGHFFDGGAGRDTIIANVAEFLANSYAIAGRIKNVEVIHFANVLATDIDASMFTGEDTYVLGAGLLVPVTISKVTDGSTVDIRSTSFDTLTVSIGEGATLATVPGTNNTLNIAVGGKYTTDLGTIAAPGVETLTVTSNGTTLNAGGNLLTIIAGDARSLTIGGSAMLTLTMSGGALTYLDASAATGDLDLSLVTFKTNAPATIIGGHGVDKLRGTSAADTIDGGAGADVIAGGGGADMLTGGAGADTFYISSESDSRSSAPDTITDFVSGTDVINISDLARLSGRFNIVLRADAAPSRADAEAALVAGSGHTQVVFQADAQLLWVDVNDDGKLDAADTALKLEGVTRLKPGDVGGTARPEGFGNFITLDANGAVVSGSAATGATLTTTASDDGIWGTVERVNSITKLDGLSGTDTLHLLDAGVITVPSTVTSVERIILATVATAPNSLAINADGVHTIIGSENADTVTTANMTTSTGASITLGAGADTLNLSASLPGTVIDLGADDDVVNIAAGVVVTSTLSGGAGIDTLNLGNGVSIASASISGFEKLDASSASSDFSLATTQDFTSIKFGAGSDTITNVVASSSAVVIELGAGNDTVSTLRVGTGALTLDFGSGNATIGNIAAHGSGKLILKFADAPGVATAVTIAATDANLALGDLIDFASPATSIVNAKADGSQGMVSGVGQVFIDTVSQPGNTIITFDADGSRGYTSGDVQITVVGNVLGGNIDINGSLSITASA
jgi:Ca2+-binding RTX toxin-like protein